MGVFKLLNPKLQKVVKERGFVKPTLPQTIAIPSILNGENILLIAPVGTGKTESAMIPIFNLILEKKPNPINTLYITPLKALNRDLLDRLIWWSNKLDIEISVRHGDTSQYERKMQMEFPPQILIVTLETLQPILVGKRIREHLRNVKWVILDEVHEVVDSKRGVQLSIGLERVRKLAGNFQLIMLSATVGEPEKVANFFGGGRDIKIKKAFLEKKMNIKVIHPSPTSSDRKISEKLFCTAETVARLRKIHELASKHTSILTFTNTREFAEILASRLKAFDKKFPFGVHHSSLSKGVRIDVEKKFKKEELKAVIATSSLQLGIDIGSVDLVIQYMSPRQVTQLIQRVGRSGHEERRISKGVIITTDEDDIFESAVIAKDALEGKLDEIKIHEKSLDVLAHQILGFLLEYRDIHPNEIFEIIRKSFPYRNLSYKEFIEICKFLSQIGLVFLNEKIRKRRRGINYYFSQLSTIPTIKQYRVFNVIDNSFVGILDEEFVAIHANIGTTFIMKGEAWKVNDITGDKVLVEPVVDMEAAIPAWEGELIPVPFEVAQEVGKTRRKIKELIKKEGEDSAIQFLKQNFPLDENCCKRMVNYIKKQIEFGFVPDDKNILIEDYENTVIIHTCFGSMVNETFGRVISSLLTGRVGSVGLRVNPYRVIIQFQMKNLEALKEIIFKTNPKLIEEYLRLSLPKTNLFQWKFVQVAKRFGVLEKDAEYGKIKIEKLIDAYSNSPVFEETFNELKIEKLDIERTVELLKKIQSKEIKVEFRKGLSPIGRLGLRRYYLEAIGPEKPEIEIFELFKQRLLNTKIRLICLNCGKWDEVFTVKELPEDMKCRKCEARLLAITNPNDRKSIKIVKKKLARRALTHEEKKKYERLRKTADLFLSYRREAAITLAGKGIGPLTAMRILARYRRNEDELFKDILRAERKYLRTRRYWSI